MVMRQKIKHKLDIFTFGKFKGKTVRYVLEHEPSYILWLVDNQIVDFPQEIIDNAEDANWEIKDPYGMQE